jgi:hypothetical protein
MDRRRVRQQVSLSKVGWDNKFQAYYFVLCIISLLHHILPTKQCK